MVSWSLKYLTICYKNFQFFLRIVLLQSRTRSSSSAPPEDLRDTFQLLCQDIIYRNFFSWCIWNPPAQSSHFIRKTMRRRNFFLCTVFFLREVFRLWRRLCGMLFNCSVPRCRYLLIWLVCNSPAQSSHFIRKTMRRRKKK